MQSEEIRKLYMSGIPIFIWGAGEIGQLVRKRLEVMGISTEFIVDYQAATADESFIINSSQYDNGFAIVRGWLGAFYLSDEEIRKRFNGCKKVLTLTDMYEPDYVEEITAQFYEENRSEFDRVFQLLGDELSKSTFNAYLRSKINHQNNELLPLVEKKQYFFDGSPWKYYEDDVFVDCGAFDGDSIKAFLDSHGDKYSKIIAFEPDLSNYEKLSKWVEETGKKNIELVNAGVHKERRKVKFAVSGDMCSSCTEVGDSTIETETIDNIVGNKKASIIKMDIEGCEKEALIGAKKTIEKNSPILMVSVYHRKDDLYRICEEIQKISDKYKFFLRAHKPFPIDVVLYAIPESRMK